MIKLQSKAFLVFIFSLFLTLNSLIIPTRGYNYDTNVQIGEKIAYKRHEFNTSSNEWNPWYYLIYEISSFRDSTSLSKNYTFVEAKRWIGEKTNEFLQTPFTNYGERSDQSESLSEIGTIGHLSDVPTYFSANINHEAIILRSGIKLGDLFEEIQTYYKSEHDPDDRLNIVVINDGFGLDIGEYLCGCPEGGVTRRNLNVTFTPRGILQHIYVSDRSDFGSGGKKYNNIEYEQILDESFDYSGVTLKNLTGNWRNSYSSNGSFLTQFDLILFPTGILIMLILIKKVMNK
ncbi:MAG: hypothetical protein ACXAC6_17000 [Candidatus Hodarchaeales archaeon]